MNKKVLIVDDEAELRDILKESLEFMGYDVIEAENGSAGFELYKTSPNIDVILSDAKMPICDGKTFLKQVLSLEEEKKPLTFICSGDSLLTQDELSSLGITGLIKKPYTAEQIDLKIKKFLP